MIFISLSSLGRRISSPLPIPRGDPVAVGWPSSSARPQSGRRYAAGAVLPRNCDYLRQTGAVFVVQLKDGFVSLAGRSFFSARLGRDPNLAAVSCCRRRNGLNSVGSYLKRQNCPCPKCRGLEKARDVYSSFEKTEEISI